MKIEDFLGHIKQAKSKATYKNYTQGRVNKRALDNRMLLSGYL